MSLDFDRQQTAMHFIKQFIKMGEKERQRRRDGERERERKKKEREECHDL